MPTYEYECAKCGSITSTYGEKARKTVRCHTCGGRAKKIVSMCNIAFKGPGFHKNDYGKYGPKKKGEKDAKA